MRCSRVPLPLLVILALALAACADGPATGDPGTETGAGDSAGVASNPADCVEQFEQGTDYFPDKLEFSHATSVSVTYADHYKVVTVDPAANQGDPNPATFVLVQCGTPSPELTGELEGARVLEVPAREVVSLTTTNLPHFEQLGAVDRLAGVGVPGFVTTTPVVERIEAGELDGYADAAGQPDVEKLLGLGPDLVIMDAFGDDILGEVDRLGDAGLPAALNADFNEQTLLGRAEWVKFTALLLNLEAEAQAAFDEVEQAYDEVRATVADVSERPKVFANTPYEGTWYMPGGGSYFATAVDEAGGDYAFGDDDATFSHQLDIETVLARAGDADVWLQAGSVNGTLADLAAQDERFTNFEAFQTGEVWAYDKWTSPGGGYAVFEVAYARPDLFLADLVSILHPDALPDHDTVFFGKVPAGDGSAAGDGA